MLDTINNHKETRKKLTASVLFTGERSLECSAEVGVGGWNMLPELSLLVRRGTRGAGEAP